MPTRSKFQLGPVTATPTPPTRLQLKVTLDGIRPAIWRRVVVPSEITLTSLHHVIQAAMGWTNSHLHQFSRGDQELPGRTRVATVFDQARAKVRYLYDFGDSWSHTVVLEQVLPTDPERWQAEVLAGQHAGPPEDCGGVHGYVGMLEVLDDPRHPEREEFLEWLGGAWDPEAFDLGEANARLPHLRPPKPQC